jgi:hypothetical protein
MHHLPLKGHFLSRVPAQVLRAWSVGPRWGLQAPSGMVEMPGDTEIKIVWSQIEDTSIKMWKEEAINREIWLHKYWNLWTSKHLKQNWKANDILGKTFTMNGRWLHVPSCHLITLICSRESGLHLLSWIIIHCNTFTLNDALIWTISYIAIIKYGYYL